MTFSGLYDKLLHAFWSGNFPSKNLATRPFSRMSIPTRAQYPPMQEVQTECGAPGCGYVTVVMTTEIARGQLPDVMDHIKD